MQFLLLYMLSFFPVDGRTFTLVNKNHCTAVVTDYGARLISLKVPDQHGQLTEVVLGFNTVEEYGIPYPNVYGATVGRYANRIAGGKFRLKDSVYHLDLNNAPNTIHGGSQNFSSKTWDVQVLDSHTIEFSCLSPDGDQGFPGNLKVNVLYSLTDDNALSITYTATTDRPTVINLTNHAYFNLNGEGSGSIERHQLKINADGFTPVDSFSIPYGKVQSVSGTPFDFRKFKAIGRDINKPDSQLRRANGYDHNFVVRGSGLRSAAVAKGDRSGIVMEVLTTEPALQLYTANGMSGKNNLRKGTDTRRSAFCIETEHYPDSPNHPQFPSTTLLPGNQFKSQTIYRFLVSRSK